MNAKRTPVLCFGAGSLAENVLSFFLPECIEIKAYIDERPFMRGATHAGSPVIDFAQIPDYSFDYILVACRPAERVGERLRALGIPAEKIVSLDLENYLWQKDAQDDAALCAALLAYLSGFPGVVQAIDVSALLESPWLRGTRVQIQQAVISGQYLLPEGVPMSDEKSEQALLPHLAMPPPLPKIPEELRGIHIEASNICSYRCFCCSVWNTRRPRGVISEESLNILIQRVGMFRGEVALNYCGEPLHDKDLPKKIQILRKVWPEATLNFVSTLGEDVGEDFLDALWDKGLNRLDVSFYGYTPELYKKIHGVSRFDLAYRNLRHVLASNVRKRNKGQVRLRSLHVEEQASFLDADYSAVAAAFRAEVQTYPDVSCMDMYLMTQAGAGKIHSKRGTWLPCSIAWGAFARELYVTWELDVALCCAVTGDELRLGNLRDQSLEEIFTAKAYQNLIRAHWDDRLDAYPFCKRCERQIGGTAEELVRVSSWKISNLLQNARRFEPLFSIVGESRLVRPLTALYRQHIPGFLPLAELRNATGSNRPAYIFIAAEHGAQLEFYRELNEDTTLAGRPGVHIIPLLGVGFPKPQKTIATLADIYAKLEL